MRCWQHDNLETLVLFQAEHAFLLRQYDVGT